MVDLLRLVPSLVSRPLHMALALPWVFVFTAEGTAQRFLGLSLTIIGTLSCGFIALNESSLSEQYGFISGGWQVIVAASLILLTSKWPEELLAGHCR